MSVNDDSKPASDHTDMVENETGKSQPSGVSLYSVVSMLMQMERTLCVAPILCTEG